MSLPLATLQELVKLSGFHKKGALLKRHFDALKKHVMAGNCIRKDNWEAMDLTLELRQGGVFPEDEWTKQTDGKDRDITNSAAASRSTQTDDALLSTTTTTTTTTAAEQATSNYLGGWRGRESGQISYGESRQRHLGQ